MSQTLTCNQPQPAPKVYHPFLEELIKQIRQRDTSGQYQNASDELVVNQFLMPSHPEAMAKSNSLFDPLNQLLAQAFYHAVGVMIERKTGHTTDTFVHLKNEDSSSALICCGGVLVLCSFIWGDRTLSFLSLSELIEAAETNIRNAITKASLYLNFAG